MAVSTTIDASAAVYETDVSRAVRSLGAALKTSPEFVAFRAASQALDADATAQGSLQQIHTRQFELRWGQDNRAEHFATLHKLQADLEALPSVQAYYQAEQAARELFVTIDAVISETAGADFAANAKRSCCGG